MTDLEYLKSFDVILPVWTMGQIDDNNWEIKNSKIEAGIIGRFKKNKQTKKYKESNLSSLCKV